MADYAYLQASLPSPSVVEQARDSNGLLGVSWSLQLLGRDSNSSFQLPDTATWLPRGSIPYLQAPLLSTPATPRYKMRAVEVGDGFESWVVLSAPDSDGSEAPNPVEPGTVVVSAELEVVS